MSAWAKARMLVVGPGMLRDLGVEAGDEVRLEVVNELARVLRKPKGTDAWTQLWSGPADDLRPKVPFFPGTKPGTVEIQVDRFEGDFEVESL